jgi:hypothetical protein
MADISKRLPDCDDECGKRGKRGKSGKRGHRGHRGHDGPPGSSGLGLLKFSGFASAFSPNNGPVISFLADAGVGLGPGSIINFAPSYPMAVVRNLRNLSVNILGFVVPGPNGFILVELIDMFGNLVPGFSVGFGPAAPSILTALTPPTPFAIGSTFDLRVTTTGLGVLEISGVDMSATIGVE